MSQYKRYAEWYRNYYNNYKKKVRAEIFKIVGNKCANCGITGVTLDLHHIEYVREHISKDKRRKSDIPSVADAKYLIPLCRLCHRRLHTSEEFIDYNLLSKSKKVCAVEHKYL